MLSPIAVKQMVVFLNVFLATVLCFLDHLSLVYKFFHLSTRKKESNMDTLHFSDIWLIHIDYVSLISLVFMYVDMVSSQLKLHRYHTSRESRVITALSLLKSHLFR